MIRTRYFTAGLLVGVLLLTVGLGKAHRLSGKPKSLQGKLALARAQVRHDRATGDSWLVRDRAYARQLQRLIRPYPFWWLRQALCVKSHEGGWRSNTGNGFYGGMQFDRQTWLVNGGGRFALYAHLASPREQLLVAWWTWQRRGWSPWPATSRMCGLR